MDATRIHGFPRQKKTFKRLTDAKLWAQQTEAAIRKGEFQNVVSTARSKTLNDVIERYRDDVLPHKALSTQRAETTYLAFWERELGKYALSYIEPQLISAKLRELGEAGDGRRKAERSAGQSFPDTENVRHDVSLFASKHCPGSTKACCDFVGNQKHIVSSTGLANPCDRFRRVKLHPARALNQRLDNDSGNLVLH